MYLLNYPIIPTLDCFCTNDSRWYCKKAKLRQIHGFSGAHGRDLIHLWRPNGNGNGGFITAF